MEGLFAELEEVDHVLPAPEGITSPYSEEGASQISPDGTIAFATVHFENLDGESVPIEVGQEILRLADEAEQPGLAIEPGGGVIAFSEFEEPGGAEMFGFLAAIIILLITFGSFIAMGLPILMALVGIGIGMALIMIFANFLTVPDFTPQLASMIGIGVGIDYALFIVTRYRQHLHSGDDPEHSNMVAIVTAGRAVLFAGTTVVISLLGILLMGFAFVEGVAVGGAATVLVTMLASVTLLAGGDRIRRARTSTSSSCPWFHRADKDHHVSMWFRWSRLIQRRPGPIAFIAFIALIALAIPVFAMELGFADAASSPPDRSSRRAYDLLSEGFGPGFNGPLLLAAEIDSPEDLESLAALSEQLARRRRRCRRHSPVPQRGRGHRHHQRLPHDLAAA